jgi:tryptophan synthase alpha chain
MNTAKKKLLNIYFTAGYPEIGAFQQILDGLQEAGVDFIEIGLPYSDPLADGPTIQASSAKALANGITMDRVFDQLEQCRRPFQAEIYLMGYYNQWLKYGLEKFCQRAQKAGVSGLIIPDLPIEYFDREHQELLKKYQLKISFLVTPDTNEARIEKVDELTTGFVYLVSSRSTTGATDNRADNSAYLERMASYPFSHQTLIGFGIHDHATYTQACRFADGAIIGSAFIRHIANDFSKPSILNFVNHIKNGK